MRQDVQAFKALQRGMTARLYRPGEEPFCMHLTCGQFHAMITASSKQDDCYGKDDR